MNRFVAILGTIGIVSGCAHELAPPQAQATWEAKCYSGMRSDALALAAPSAKDCGFASISGGAGVARQVRKCVATSLKNHKPFIAGFQSIGTDSGFCESLATLPNGRWALLDVDYDRSGGVLIGNGPVLDVLECAVVTAPWSFSQPFSQADCQRSRELLGLLSQ